jgi:hypothetical protein
MSMVYCVENVVTVTYLEESVVMGKFLEELSDELFEEVSVELNLLLCEYDFTEGGRTLTTFYTKEVHSKEVYDNFIELLLSMGYKK